jgi:hypothetical protein
MQWHKANPKSQAPNPKQYQISNKNLCVVWNLPLIEICLGFSSDPAVDAGCPGLGDLEFSA